MSFNLLTQVSKVNEESLKLAKTLIENEELVAFPTETVYGLGAIATSDIAVKKIYEVKGRPSDNPLIVHVHKNYDLSKLVYVDYDYVYDLQKAFLPGALTMVYRAKGNVSKIVSCGLDTLAIRVPSNKDAQKFLEYVNLPIAAPSANVSKHTSPVTAEHVYNDLNGKINLILDGGKCTGGIESTVLDVTTETPTILRSGLITSEMIKKVVGKCEYSNSTPTDKVRSPGCKYQHYTPKCETVLFERNEIEKAQNFYDLCEKNGKIPYFMCDGKIAKILKGRILNLGESGEEIASNLYDKLLYGEKVASILIGVVIDSGSEIDVGVLNRMRKAFKPHDIKDF